MSQIAFPSLLQKTSGNLLPFIFPFFPRRGTVGRAGIYFLCSSLSSLEEGRTDERETSFQNFFWAYPDHIPTEPKTQRLWTKKVNDIQQRKFQLRRVLNIYETLSLFFYFVDLAKNFVFLFNIFVMLQLV